MLCLSEREKMKNVNSSLCVCLCTVVMCVHTDSQWVSIQTNITESKRQMSAPKVYMAVRIVASNYNKQYTYISVPTLSSYILMPLLLMLYTAEISCIMWSRVIYRLQAFKVPWKFPHLKENVFFFLSFFLFSFFLSFFLSLC